MSENLVLLHGFGGTRHAWDRVIAELDPQRYRSLAIDLPGHGEAREQRMPITFGSCIAAVLAQSPDRFVLCGYSMGGRIALHVALAAPERVSRLVLVASSPGIEDPVERTRRRVADQMLANELEAIPFERFIERWRSQPLFAGDPPEVDTLAREQYLRNDPHALAAVMRGVGTGAMEPLWDRLGELAMPMTIVAGKRDVKFRQLGERIAARAHACELVIVPGGHALALETPARLAVVLQTLGHRTPAGTARTPKR